MKSQSDIPAQVSPQNSPGAYGAQFQNVPIPAHIHNGMDSLKISYKNLTDTPTIPVTYAGIINSTVASSTLPTGWSASKSGTGDYVVTHNLRTTKYIVVCTTYTYVVSLGSVTSTTFEVLAVSLSGTAVDVNVNFILYKL